MNTLRSGGTIRDFKVKLRAKNGEVKHFLLNSNLYQEKGRWINSRCFLRADVTVPLEKELTAKTELFTNILQNSPIWTSEFDLNGKFISINGAGKRSLVQFYSN